MKMYSKILCLILVLALFAAMALGSSSDDGETKDIVNGNNSSKVAVTIEEQVLLTWNDITITAKEYVSDSFWGDGIKVLIENNGTTDVGISCNALIVNNYMVTDLFSSTVAAGKSSNETIYLSSTDLNAAGIENVGQIEFYFHFFDSSSYTTLHDANVVTLKTSAYDQMDAVPNDLGVELYNKNGIKIVGKYVDENSFWGAAVFLYVENTSDRNVTVSCEDLSVNGFMVDAYFYSNVYSNKMAMDTITLFSEDLEKNGITSIDEIELKFHIYDSDTYRDIDETDAITFSTK